MPDQERTPITSASKDDAHPVVWTPEDASRFLTSAIHEAQRPLAEALKQRPITSKAFAVIIAILAVAALAIALLLSSQLEKTEGRADAINRQREELLTQKVRLEAQSTLLEERLAGANEEITTLTGAGEQLRSAKSDILRFRRQNELLRSQISGLEMEKVALARQLEAVKAMAIDDSVVDNEGELDLIPLGGEGMESVGAPIEGIVPAAPAVPEVAEAIVPEAPAVSAPVPAVAVPVAAPEPAAPAAAPEPVPEPVAEPTTELVAEPAAEPVAEPLPEVVTPEPETPESAVIEIEEVVIEIEETAESPAVLEEPAPAENFRAASEAYGEQLAQENVQEPAEPEAEVETAPPAADAAEQPAPAEQEDAPL